MSATTSTNTIVTPSESGNGEQIAPLVDENQSVLTVGVVVPPLSSESNIPHLKTKIWDVKAFFAMEKVTTNLLDASHSDWNDMQKLKVHFKFTPDKPGARPKVMDIIPEMP
jgi:hypothetical protein